MKIIAHDIKKANNLALLRGGESTLAAPLRGGSWFDGLAGGKSGGKQNPLPPFCLVAYPHSFGGRSIWENNYALQFSAPLVIAELVE